MLASLALRKWPEQRHLRQVATAPPFFSRSVWRAVQLGAALVIMLATGAAASAAQLDGQLTIAFLKVGPLDQPPPGEAIFMRTPDGKTAMIDGGLNPASLAQELDARLPFWQHSIDMVILTAPRQDDLAGLQDVITRYQVSEGLDAGMLHPSTGYALWRHTINERGLHYIQVRQGAAIPLGAWVTLQIFWPPSPLHKGRSEALDNCGSPSRVL